MSRRGAERTPSARSIADSQPTLHDDAWSLCGAGDDDVSAQGNTLCTEFNDKCVAGNVAHRSPRRVANGDNELFDPMGAPATLPDEDDVSDIENAYDSDVSEGSHVNSHERHERQMANEASLELQGPTVTITVRDLRTMEEHEVTLALDKTIKHLKGIIKNRTGLDAAKIHLVSSLQVTLRDESTLAECGLHTKSIVLFKEYNPAECHATVRNMSSARTYCVQFKPEDTVRQFKLELEKVEHTPPDYQRLMFMGKELTDSQRLKDCNMKHGAFVLLVMRALGGY